MFPFLEKRNRIKELEENGLYIGAVHNQDGLKRLAICLLRGLMVFLACYGTVVGLIDAFDIVYNHTVVTLFLFFVSMFASFLYINKPVFYIGYIILLVGFTYELVHYYYYANSGYQAIVNIIYEDYSDYFNLLTLREAQEYITDRYVTVTVAMMFIGTFLAILLNVTISGYMNLLETILITFPFLEIAFYIDKRPPLYCLIMLLISYICVGIQQASRHFKMQVKGKHTPEYLKLRRKKSTTYLYQSSATGTLQTLIWATIISVVIGLGFFPSYYSEVPIQPGNEIKKTADEYVKIFVQSGFTGLLDRYDSTGGLSQGRLGGVSSIRPDFETDLTVTFAPYSYETVYLKAFTGSHYSSNQWFPHSYLSTYPMAIEALPLSEDDLNSLETISSDTFVYMDDATINSYDSMYMPETDSQGKMEIVHIDTDYGLFRPYYSSADDAVFNSGPDHGVYLYDGTQIAEEGTISASGIMPTSTTEAVTITYTPYLGHYDEDVEAFDLPLYYDLYVNEFCLQIPDELRPVLSQYCAKQEFPGIATGSFNTATPTEPEDINAYRLEVAQAIYEHFVADFDYTMSPGTTPYRQDFVEYFLTTQKRGVCAHFAASATMLLRSMGIPARYVEGYCIPLSLMSEGQPINEVYSDWYEGPTQVTEEGVLTVDVTDAQAHAWVEIYLEGYGFVPFEMTPPDFMEDTADDFNFGNLFGNLFSFDLDMGNLPDAENTDVDYEREELPLLSFSFQTTAAPFLIMIGVLAGIALLILLGRLAYEHYKLAKLLKEENYAELIYIHYETLCKKTLKKCTSSNANPLPDELCKLIKAFIPEGEQAETQRLELEQLFHMTEKALYAPNKMTSAEYTLYQELYQKALRLIKEFKPDTKKKN